MQVSYASNNYPTVEHVKHSQTIQVSPLWKEIRIFWLKIMFSYGILGCRLPAGFRCRSGNSPNYLQLAGSYQVEKSE